MMYTRGKIRWLIILVVVIILFLPVVENSRGMELENTDQKLSHEELDVKITNLTFSESEPKEGDNITIFVTVRNNESMDEGGARRV